MQKESSAQEKANTILCGTDYSRVYNYFFYKRSNPDVAAEFGEDATLYLQHFVSYGMDEGRASHPIFDVRRYKTNMRDALGQAFRPYYMDYLNKNSNVELPMNVPAEQKALLDKAHRLNEILLRELDRVCEKYGLKYYMICGTLLGAVRHHSFIPWDDDIDVAMPRRDYERLKQIAAQEWENKKTFLLVDYSDLSKNTFLDFLCRLVYLGEEIPVVTFDKLGNDCRKEVRNRMPLDIYVLDNASDDERRCNWHTLTLQGLYGLAMAHRAYVKYDDYKDRPLSMRLKIRCLNAVGRLIPLKYIYALYEKVRIRYNHVNTESYIMSNGFVFCLPWKFDKEWFGSGTRLPINDEYFSAPIDWDAYLRRQYGDYSRLPAVKDRHPTHIFGATGIYHTIDYSAGTERIV